MKMLLFFLFWFTTHLGCQVNELEEGVGDVALYICLPLCRNLQKGWLSETDVLLGSTKVNDA